MNFLAPAAFAFAAAIPVVIVFYMLKRRRVVKLVSSTLLWQKFLAETQASAPFQRLRHNWLLILQLLMLVLLIFALARPYFAGQERGGRLRVIILDASASMQSTDEKPNRFEKAREEALQFISTLHDSDETVILQAGAQTEVKQSATSDKGALRRAINASIATDSPTRLAEAFKLSETLIKNRSDAEIHLFSDGAFPSLAEFENKNLPLVYHRVGQRANNLGIISVDVRANPEDPSQRAVFVNIGNFSTNAQQTEVELSFDDQVLEVRPINLSPTNTQPLLFVAPQSKDGVFSVRLIANDDLAADNRVSIVSLLPQPVKVLLVTRGNQILEKALRSQVQVQLSTSTLLTDPARAFDMVVLDDVMPAVWPAVNTLAFHTANTNWFSGWETVKTPPIVDWKNTHPLLRFVNFDNVFVGETLAVKAPPWGISLVESPQTPLLIAGELERQRIVWIGFDILNSSWPLRISFPIFMVNAVEWLDPASASRSQLMVHAGEPFRLGLPQPITMAEVTKPDGTTKSLAVEPDARELIFGETFRQGTYRLKAGTNQVTFCVNLMDAAESSTMPREELPFGKYGKVGATTLKRASMELWRWIALAGLVVLLFEWWYYHKRTA
jgi:hypothetical protein